MANSAEHSERMVLSNDKLFSEVDKLLAEGHMVTLQAKGNSMFPFITGSHDSVALQKPDAVKEGDIVLARLGGNRYVLHRVYRQSKPGNGYVLMGDGNVRGTETCQSEDIIGKAMAVIRPDGQRIDCNSRNQRRKARLWKWLLPVRRYLLYLLKLLHPRRQYIFPGT